MTLTDKDRFDCCGADGRLMSVDLALVHLQTRVPPVAETEAEHLPLLAALGRVLAADQVSTVAVPPFDNSAVDGWAVFAADLTPGQETRLPIGGRIAAGHPLNQPTVRGQAYRIFTGAPLPAGPDTVIMQEDCREDDGAVILPAAFKAGANIRRAGESVEIGGVPLTAGTLLGPQHLGVAATLGLTALSVRRRLRVAIFSTGDEIRDPGEPLPPGCLYDANRTTLTGLLTASDCEVTDLGILPDRLEVIRDTLDRAAAGHDLIITSGGVSVGAEDHVKAAVQSLGSLYLWRLALKPGKPLALGEVKGTAFLGLPGNPVAVMVTFLLFARPLIARLSGASFRPQRRYPLPAAFTLKKKAGRREFPRARIVQTAFGPVVELLKCDSSGVLTSMSSAEGFVDLPESAMEVVPGDSVAFLPFSEVMP
jgi:molybdopterin molybdotransferase